MITYTTKEHVAAIFNLWQKRAVEKPEEFGDFTASENYGERCAEYFEKLSNEVAPHVITSNL
jgi:hypothetical protein